MFSRRPWQGLTAHQGAAAPSLGTADLTSKEEKNIYHNTVTGK